MSGSWRKILACWTPHPHTYPASSLEHVPCMSDQLLNRSIAQTPAPHPSADKRSVSVTHPEATRPFHRCFSSTASERLRQGSLELHFRSPRPMTALVDETDLPPAAPPGFSDHTFKSKSGIELAIRVWPAKTPITEPAPFVLW